MKSNRNTVAGLLEYVRILSEVAMKQLTQSCYPRPQVVRLIGEAISWPRSLKKSFRFLPADPEIAYTLMKPD